MAIATLFEAFAFTAVVLIDIWFLHSRTWWGDALPGVFALVSFAAHREPLGLGVRDLGEALGAWRVVLMLSAAAVLVGLLFKSHPLNLLLRGIVYFAWCVVQQLLFQNMIYRRIRSALGATGARESGSLGVGASGSPGAGGPSRNWRTTNRDAACAVLSGVLFAAVHAPNPVLVPATLVWGTISTRLFERRPSIIAIALLQTLLSSLLIWLTPVAWNHQFRVGPGYWRYR